MPLVQVKTELSPATVTNLVVEDGGGEDTLIMIAMILITSAHCRHTSIALPRSFQERKLKI